MVKKSYREIQKSFRIIISLYAQFLTKNVLILQNVPIPLNFLPPMQSSPKFVNTSILYTTDALFNKMFQYQHIVYYQHTVLQLFNKHCIYFFFSYLTLRYPTIYWDVTLLALILYSILFKCFAFFKFNMLDEKPALIRLKIKIICLTKSFFLIVIKITVFSNYLLYSRANPSYSLF